MWFTATGNHFSTSSVLKLQHYSCAVLLFLWGAVGHYTHYFQTFCSGQHPTPLNPCIWLIADVQVELSISTDRVLPWSQLQATQSTKAEFEHEFEAFVGRDYKHATSLTCCLLDCGLYLMTGMACSKFRHCLLFNSLVGMIHLVLQKPFPYFCNLLPTNLLAALKVLLCVSPFAIYVSPFRTCK